MSRLIRISTEDDNAIFNEQFEEDLVIDENSTIALQSANFSRLQTSLVLNHLNNIFLLQTNDDAPEGVDIVDFMEVHQDQVVNHTNFRGFLTNITLSANRTLSAIGTDSAGNEVAAKGQADSGVQYLVSANSANKVVIEVRKEKAVKWTADANLINDSTAVGIELFDVGGGVHGLRKTAASQDDGDLNEGFLLGKRPINKGGSYIQAKVATLADADAPAQWAQRPTAGRELLMDADVDVGENPAYEPDQAGQSGFVIGLVNKDGRDRLSRVASGLEGQFDLDDFYAFMGWQNDLQVPYFFGYGKENSNRPESFPNPAERFEDLAHTQYYSKLLYEADDEVGITLDRGVIKFFVKRANGDVELPLNDDMEEEAEAAEDVMELNESQDDYFWVICLLGKQAKTVLTQVEATHDPYVPHQEVASKFGSFYEATGGLGTSPHPAVGTGITPSLEFAYTYGGGRFNNTELRDFLGFSSTQSRIDTTVSGVNHKFVADNAAHELIDVDTYNVLLNNIPLESYDTVPKGRQNLLFTIVNPRDKSDTSGVAQVAFNSNYPIGLKIKNKNKLMLRTIQARIVNGQYEPIVTQGLSSLTLIVGKDS